MVTTRKPSTPRKAASRPRKARQPFNAFAYLIELGKALPEDELARMPRDGAQYLDDYLEGARKDPGS